MTGGDRPDHHGLNPPSCRCHGEPMEWNKDPRPRFKAGGYWRCKVKHAAARSRYDQGEKGRATARRYRESPMGQLRSQLHELTRVRY